MYLIIKGLGSLEDLNHLVTIILLFIVIFLGHMTKNRAVGFFVFIFHFWFYSIYIIINLIKKQCSELFSFLGQVLIYAKSENFQYRFVTHLC